MASSGSQNFELIFDGLVDDSQGTLRAIKASFLADIGLEIAEIQRILSEAPATVTTSHNLEELKRLEGKLTAAGGKVTVRELDISPYFPSVDDEVVPSSNGTGIESNGASALGFEVDIDELLTATEEEPLLNNGIVKSSKAWAIHDPTIEEIETSIIQEEDIKELESGSDDVESLLEKLNEPLVGQVPPEEKEEKGLLLQLANDPSSELVDDLITAETTEEESAYLDNLTPNAEEEEASLPVEPFEEDDLALSLIAPTLDDPPEVIPKEIPIPESAPVPTSGQMGAKAKESEIEKPESGQEISSLERTKIHLASIRPEAPIKRMFGPLAGMLITLLLIAISLFLLTEKEDFTFFDGLEEFRRQLLASTETEVKDVTRANLYTGSFSSKDLSSKGMCLFLAKNNARCIVRLNTPPPSELTPEQIVDGKLRAPWLRRMQTGWTKMESKNENILSASSRTRVFIDYNNQRRFIIASLKMNYSGGEKGNLFIELFSHEGLSEPRAKALYQEATNNKEKVALRVLPSDEIAFHVIVEYPLKLDSTFDPTLGLPSL
jgi:hypothetical protein